jgi:two-component system LytT family response regulator
MDVRAGTWLLRVREPMNLLIVDNEPAVRAGLLELCERTDDLCVVGEASSGAKAIQAAEALRPDLLLLDADLPDMTGFDVLRALRARHLRRTILLTANTQDAATVFAAGALDHLVKPVSPEAFATSIMRARERFKNHIVTSRRALGPLGSSRSHAVAEHGTPLVLVGEREHRLYPLDPQKVDYIESAGNYVKYRIAGDEYIARESVKRLDAVLRPVGFVRIERSLLLNIRAISYAQPIGHGTFSFTLVSGARLHSGPAYRETILGALPLRRRSSARGGERGPRTSDESNCPEGTAKKVVTRMSGS